MFENPFSAREIDRRLAALRSRLVQRQLAAAVVAQPENVFYLTGLDHWGYFAPHLLIVPADGTPVLVTRAMERVTIERQVRAAAFRGHADTETAADVAKRVLAELGLAGAPVGLEFWTAGLSHGLGLALTSRFDARWSDISGLVDDLRLVKSPEEIGFVRRAAAVSGAAADAAIAAIAEGAFERDVAAACMAAMIRAGGQPPGFGPFIRPGARLGEEHATWGDGRYGSGGTVFLELSGCVARYHAPLGRLVYLAPPPEKDVRMAEVVADAFEAVLAALRPGARARDVYAAWQSEVDAAGLSHYRRHHCGYAVGIGCPPSWTGGNTVVGLRADSDLEIRQGMTFHILSWLMGTGRGDAFISNTVLVGPGAAEVLTGTAPIARP